MRRKIPPDAFDYYMSLGVGRSYQAVADKYEVSKVAVNNRAKKEKWQDRLREIEEAGRKRAAEKATETMEQVNTRHLRAMRVVQGKALEALKTMSLTTAMEAVRSLELSVKGERLILGEPSDRTSLTVDAIRERFERWTSEVEEASTNGSGHRGT